MPTKMPRAAKAALWDASGTARRDSLAIEKWVVRPGRRTVNVVREIGRYILVDCVAEATVESVAEDGRTLIMSVWAPVGH